MPCMVSISGRKVCFRYYFLLVRTELIGICSRTENDRSAENNESLLDIKEVMTLTSGQHKPRGPPILLFCPAVSEVDVAGVAAEVDMHS